MFGNVQQNFDEKLVRFEGQESVLMELETWCKPEDNDLDLPAKHKGDCIHASGKLRKKIQEIRERIIREYNDEMVY